MAPSASKQKRLAEKAAKQAAKGTDASTSTSTPNGSSVNTPLTSMSAATSQEDLTSMAKLKVSTDRYCHTTSHFASESKRLINQGRFVGVPLVCSCPTSRAVTLKSTLTPSHSMVSYSSRMLRSLSITANGMVFSARTVLEKCVISSLALDPHLLIQNYDLSL